MRYVIVPQLEGSIEFGLTVYEARCVDTWAWLPGTRSDRREEVPELAARYYAHAIQVENDRGHWTLVERTVAA